MLRLAVDIRHLATPIHTGIAQYTISLLHALIPLAPHISFILVSSGHESLKRHIPAFPYQNCTHIHVPVSNRFLALRTLFSPSFTLEQLLSHEIDAWFFPNLNFIKTNKPYFLTIHDLSFLLFPEFFTLKQRLWHKLVQPKRLAQKATHLFTVSEHTKSDLITCFHIPHSSISVTYLGIPSALQSAIPIHPQKQLQKLGITTPYFLALSSFEPRKNLSRLILAYNHFRQTTQYSSPPHLVLAGGGGWKERQLLRLIQNSPFTKDIHIIRSFSEADKFLLYTQAEAFFFPSIYEGFGLPPLEALASGTPIIVSQTSSLPELFEHHAILVNPLAPHDLAFAMEQILEPEVRKYYLTSHHTIRERYSFEETAKHTLSAIEVFFPSANNS